MLNTKKKKLCKNMFLIKCWLNLYHLQALHVTTSFVPVVRLFHCLWKNHSSWNYEYKTINNNATLFAVELMVAGSSLLTDNVIFFMFIEFFWWEDIEFRKWKSSSWDFCFVFCIGNWQVLNHNWKSRGVV